MPHSVRFSDEADAQLRELGQYITEQNSIRVAMRYIAAIVKTCNCLAVLPNRGRKRDRILKGLRTIGFRRRVLIAFQVNDATVDILAILYGGQDLAKYFKSLKK